MQTSNTTTTLSPSSVAVAASGSTAPPTTTTTTTTSSTPTSVNVNVNVNATVSPSLPSIPTSSSSSSVVRSATKRLIPLKQPTILEASKVYWICHDYSFSQRNARLLWYLRHYISRQPLPLPVDFDVGSSESPTNDVFMVVARDSAQLMHQLPGVSQALLAKYHASAQASSSSSSSSTSTAAHSSSGMRTPDRLPTPVANTFALPDGTHSTQQKLDWLLNALQCSDPETLEQQLKTEQQQADTLLEQVWFRVVGGTRLIQLSGKYGIVISIDVSSSMLAIDVATGKVVLSLVYPCIERCLRSLITAIPLSDCIVVCCATYTNICHTCEQSSYQAANTDCSVAACTL
jgi:hypothetical protein